MVHAVADPGAGVDLMPVRVRPSWRGAGRQLQRQMAGPESMANPVQTDRWKPG